MEYVAILKVKVGLFSGLAAHPGPRAGYGHDGVRECAELLYRAINEPGAYRHSALRCDDRVALLEWSANCAGMQVADGVDAFLVEDGLIHVQTIR